MARGGPRRRPTEAGGRALPDGRLLQGFRTPRWRSPTVPGPFRAIIRRTGSSSRPRPRCTAPARRRSTSWHSARPANSSIRAIFRCRSRESLQTNSPRYGDRIRRSLLLEVRDFLARTPAPDARPPFINVTVGPDGSAWFIRSKSIDGHYEYFGLDPGGAPIGRIRIREDASFNGPAGTWPGSSSVTTMASRPWFDIAS